MFNNRNEETSPGFIALRVEKLDEAVSRRQAVQADTCPGGERISVDGPYPRRVVFDFESILYKVSGLLQWTEVFSRQMDGTKEGETRETARGSHPQLRRVHAGTWRWIDGWARISKEKKKSTSANDHESLHFR